MKHLHSSHSGIQGALTPLIPILNYTQSINTYIWGAIQNSTASGEIIKSQGIVTIILDLEEDTGKIQNLIFKNLLLPWVTQAPHLPSLMGLRHSGSRSFQGRGLPQGDVQVIHTCVEQREISKDHTSFSWM